MTKDSKHILCIGNMELGSNALSLFKGIQYIEEDVVLVDTSKFDAPNPISIGRIVKHFTPRLYGYFASRKLDKIIADKIDSREPSIVIVFRGSYLSANTLRRLKGLKVHYHPDDSTNKVNRTSIFERAEGEYDFHFTSKRHNIPEIFERTNKVPFFFWYAYDPDWHFREKEIDFSNPKYTVGFIGHFRPDRGEVIQSLAAKYQKNLAIAGSRWNKIPDLGSVSTVLGPIYGPDFAKFVQLAPLQLGFLNSDNRDQHTARSFEIPASGGLLLAEDTNEHREIFQSEENALFFKDEKELQQKIRWVREHPLEAERIANNGYLLITGNGNTWKDRAKFMLDVVSEIRSS